MQSQSDQQYKQLLTEVIKKQIVILGPDITLAKARNVPGLVIDGAGTVTQISGEPQQITQNLIDQFVQLSGLIVKKTMEPLLTYHAAVSEASPSPLTPPAPIPEPSPPLPPSPQDAIASSLADLTSQTVQKPSPAGNTTQLPENKSVA